MTHDTEFPGNFIEPGDGLERRRFIGTVVTIVTRSGGGVELYVGEFNHAWYEGGQTVVYSGGQRAKRYRRWRPFQASIPDQIAKDARNLVRAWTHVQAIAHERVSNHREITL